MLEPAHTGLYQLLRADHGHLCSGPGTSPGSMESAKVASLTAWKSAHAVIRAFYPGEPVLTRLSVHRWPWLL